MDYDFIRSCDEVIKWYLAVMDNWIVKYENEWKRRNLITCLSFVQRMRWLFKSSDSKHHKMQADVQFNINANDADLTYNILYNAHVCDLLDILMCRADIELELFEPSTQSKWSRVLTGFEADLYFGRHPASFIGKYLYCKVK